MVNKRGWIKIVEASLAIFVIFSILLVISAQNKIKTEKDYIPYLNDLLNEIAKNATLRADVLAQHDDNRSEIIGDFLTDKIKLKNFGYDHKICPVNDICGLTTYPADAEEIYSAERVISSTLDQFNPKKIKIFLWRKK